MFRGARHSEKCAPFEEFEFTMKVRVDCLPALWRAAAERHMDANGGATEDLADLLGPVEDPSIENCLMMLALPQKIAGCTMIDASLERDFVNAGTASH
jgi:hypothetical protein